MVLYIQCSGMIFVAFTAVKHIGFYINRMDTYMKVFTKAGVIVKGYADQLLFKGKYEILINSSIYYSLKDARGKGK